ncbi:MAG: DUF523 domain-containing protein [Halobacteriovoraceae bacterium]|nr:DUF523 domain-containing protein [Halobacteriovoraceae bacterium]
MKKYKYIVSSCLCGINCRYDGQNKLSGKVKKLVDDGLAIAVCPEELGGLQTPRPPSENRQGRYFTIDGEDVTEQFQKGAQLAALIAKENICDTAILKSKSPMCGMDKVYDGNFSGSLVDGDGEFVKELKKLGITIVTEEDIK